MEAMERGYLYLEQSREHPDTVRVGTSKEDPGRHMPPPGAEAPVPDPVVIYVGHFRDIDAARMHAHEAMKRRCVDLENRRYRVSPVAAVAALDGEFLRHETTFIDPRLEAEHGAELAAATLKRIRRHERFERFMQWVAYGAVALLLFNLATSVIG